MCQLALLKFSLVSRQAGSKVPQTAAVEAAVGQTAKVTYKEQTSLASSQSHTHSLFFLKVYVAKQGGACI